MLPALSFLFNRKTFLARSVGVSLVELSVAMAVGSIIMVMLAAVHFEGQKSRMRASSSNDIEDAITQIRQHLYRQGLCNATFETLIFNPDPLPINQINNQDGTPAFQVNQRLGYATIISMELSGFTPIDTFGGQAQGNSTLLVTFRGTGVNSTELVRPVPLLITRNTGTLEIDNCGATTDDGWRASPFNANNIYTNNRIGIGNPATPNFPAAPVDIQNFPIAIGDQVVAGGNRLIIDQVGGAGFPYPYTQLRTTNNLPLLISAGTGVNRTTRFTFDSNNRMGVGMEPGNPVQPLQSWLDLGPRFPDPNMDQLELNHGAAHNWRFSLDNGGNDFSIRRTSGPGHSTFVLQAPLSVNSTNPPPAGYNFHVNGTAGGSEGWWPPSDRRLKTDFKKIQNPEELILALRPVSYQLKNSKLTDRLIGFIAQELKEIIPEVVTGEETASSFLGVKLDSLTALLIEGIKELDKKIKDSQHKLDNFIKRICEAHPEDEVCSL